MTLMTRTRRRGFPGVLWASTISVPDTSGAVVCNLAQENGSHRLLMLECHAVVSRREPAPARLLGWGGTHSTHVAAAFDHVLVYVQVMIRPTPDWKPAASKADAPKFEVGDLVEAVDVPEEQEDTVFWRGCVHELKPDGQVCCIS